MIKKLNTLFTWILLPILFVSCTGNKAYDKLLIKADCIMNIIVNPCQGKIEKVDKYDFYGNTFFRLTK